VLGELQARSRLILFCGLGLMGLAFVLSWWSITKYRISYERGVNMAVPAEKQEMFHRLGNNKADYQRQLDEYAVAWATNTKQYHAYYVGRFGNDYQRDLGTLMDRSLKSGTLYYRGWSTWTGWLGIVTILVVVGIYVAPRFKPEEMEEWAWTAPWAAACLGGLYLLLALAFFFSEPDENDAGYSQGIGLGCYVAILGGLATTLGGLVVGLSTARLAGMESDSDEEEDETAPAMSAPKRPAFAPPAATKPPESKNRLNDW
jgi:hypothetical protein